MTEKTWTVDEEVLFSRPEAFLYEHEGIEPPRKCVYGRVTGTTAEGHRFMCLTPVTEDLLADKGETWVAAFLRDSARPPEGEPSAEADLVFDAEE